MRANVHGLRINNNVRRSHMNQKTTCPQCETPFEVAGERFSSVISCPSCATKFCPMDELTKKAWEMTKTPEFQATLEADVAEANKGITHADFVAGVQNQTMGFKCMFGEPYQFIRGARGTIFCILFLLYMIAPAIFISLWAWHEHSWWLLAGIAVSAIGTRIASRLIYNQDKQYSIGALLLIAFVAFWFFFGIHSYYTFFALCALWGLMFFMIADNAEKDYAIQCLIEHPAVFNDAIARNRIMIIRKDDESN